MDGRIAQRFGYLGKIHLFIPDHLLRGFNFQKRIVFDDPSAAFFMEKLLQTGASDEIVSADLFNRQMGRKVRRKISADPCKGFFICIFFSWSYPERGRGQQKEPVLLPGYDAGKVR